MRELKLDELKQLLDDLDEYLAKPPESGTGRPYGRRTGRTVLQRIVDFRQANPERPIPATIANDAGRRALNARFVEMSKPIRIQREGPFWYVRFVEPPYRIERRPANRTTSRGRKPEDRARDLYERGDLIRTLILVEAQLREDENDLAALVLRSRCLIDWACYAEAVGVLERVLTLAVDDSFERLAALNNLGVCYRQLRDFDRAAALYADAEELARRRKSVGEELEVQINRCDLLLVVDEVEAAHRLVRRIVKRATNRRRAKGRAPYETLLGYVSHMHGRVLERMGATEHDAARDAYVDALALYEKTGRKVAICRVLSELGTLSRKQSDHEAARGFHLRAMQCADEIGYREAVALEHFRLAQLDIVDKQLDTAETQLAQAFQKFNEVERLEGLGYVEYTRAVLAERRGRRRDMRKALRRASGYFRLFENRRIDDDLARAVRPERKPLELFEPEDRWDVIDIWLMGLPW